MYRERKEDLSVYYWLKDLFSATSYITVVDGFPEDTLVPPVVSVDYMRLPAEHFELGNKERLGNRIWIIDVFAKNKSQRDEMAYAVLHALEESIPVYNYDEGFPPDVTPSGLGCLMIGDLVELEVIEIVPDLVDKLYYRERVTFTAEFSDKIN